MKALFNDKNVKIKGFETGENLIIENKILEDEINRLYAGLFFVFLIILLAVLVI